ncbi:hypothetical protein MTR_5g066705 [Medicago truncatula]|uniref:Uncharacterized protein n=1 Tax=Medicago truncatula TaxID=3880 RepID=A0A072UFA0_MEDTR|nr:hypothetical protein MTR_5g066705 [Medicago truncatula]
MRKKLSSLREKMKSRVNNYYHVSIASSHAHSTIKLQRCYTIDEIFMYKKQKVNIGKNPSPTSDRQDSEFIKRRQSSPYKPVL